MLTLELMVIFICHAQVNSWMPFQWSKGDEVPSLHFKCDTPFYMLVPPGYMVDNDELLGNRLNLLNSIKFVIRRGKTGVRILEENP